MREQGQAESDIYRVVGASTTALRVFRPLVEICGYRKTHGIASGSD